MIRLHLLLGTLCATLLFSATPAPAAETVTHDLELDYSFGENPDGVWSYGWKSTVSGAFNLYGHHVVQSLPGGAAFDFWVKSASAGAPPSQYHNGGVTFVNGDGTVIPPGVVWFGAGYEGNLETFGAIRFTAPALGRYRLESVVRSLLESSQAGDYDFHVVKNGVELFGIFMPAQTATGYTNNDITLGSGDVIDFLAGRGAGNTEYGSAIRIKATLTLLDLPPGNLPPTANGQAPGTPQNTPLAITLTGNDQNGDPLTFTVTTLPTHGMLSGTPPNVTYTPATGYVGPDSFAFKANDGQADSAAAAVNITISSTNGALPAPEYVKAAWIKNQDEFLVRWLRVPGATSYNVYYYEPTPATWSRVGTDLAFDPWNVPSFRMYFPGAGPATFAVTAVNSNGESAIVSASVTPGPGLIGSFTTGDEWWPKGYSFVDPSFMYDRYDELIDGMVELGLSATNFTHAAWHTNLDMGHRLHITNLSAGTAWVTRMTMVNADGIGVSYLYPYYGTYTLPLTPIDVWEDTENAISVGHFTWGHAGQLFTPATHGTIIPGNYWYDWRYTPEPNFAGTDTFQILDNPDGPPVTLTLNVQNINDAPLVYDFTVYVPEDTQSVFTPPVMDIEGDSYSIMVTSGSGNGWAVGWQGTNVLYEPLPNFVGTDEFMFIASDYDWSVPARMTIIVTNVNDPPEAALYGDWSIQAGGTYHGYVVGFDIDGDSFTAELVRPPVSGTVTIVGTNFFYTPNPGEYFGDNFSFRLFDGQSWGGEGEVFLWVNGTNTVPVAYDQSITVMEATGETNWVLDVVDPDPMNRPLEMLIISPPAHGTVTFGGIDGLTALYRPDSNYFGADGFSYQPWDRMSTGNVATVSINVRANIRPVALPQNLQLAEDTTVNITLAGLDQDGDPLTYEVLSQPSFGTLFGTAPNLAYRPATNFYGSDSFTFAVNDGRTNSNPATVSFNVTAVNDAPVRLTPDQTFTFAEDTSRIFTLAATDVEGPVNYIVVQAPTDGTITMQTANTWQFTPNANWNGTNVLRWAAADGELQSSVGTITFIVTPVNDVPVAFAQSVTMAEGGSIAITLVGSDPDGTPLQFQVTTIPLNGSLSGCCEVRTYTPYNPNFYGSDSLVFRVFDGVNYSATALVSITVTPVNDLPVPFNPNYTIPEDQSQFVLLTANDVDDTQLAYAVASLPAHGTLSGTAPSLTYTPHANYNGTDSFMFTVTDNHSAAQTGTVNFTIVPVNDAPTANAQSVTTAEDVPSNITLSGSDIEGSALTFTVINGPAHGTFANGTYTPASNYSGSDSFTFKANDGQLDSPAATVSVTVTAVNDAPVADSKSVSVSEDGSVAIALTGSDVEGSTLTFIVIDAPVHGIFVNGTYVPAANYFGPDSFTYRANDGQLNSAVATVTITVSPVNDAPVADSKSVTTAEDESVAVALTGSDVDGDTLSFSVVAAPAHGTFANGLYTPAANYFGSDSFTYEANDGQLNSPVATVSITVSAVNDAPVANGQSVSTAYNTAVNIVLTGSDIEGSALTFTVVISPANGTLTGTGANRTFTPNIGWSGTTSFTFKVNDGALDSATATVTITVAAPTGIPVAPSTLTATAVSQTQINLAWNDNSSNEDGFKIERSPNGNSSWTQIATVGPNVTTHSNTGLTKNTRYHYRVRAYNVLGNSAYSNTANARTQN